MAPDREKSNGADEEPLWVARLCELPVRFLSERNVSMISLFRQASPDVNDPRFEQLVERHLQEHPDLAGAWQNYSWDKRVNQGPYLDGTEVGVFAVGQGRSEVCHHDTTAAACADFVHREAQSLNR